MIRGSSESRSPRLAPDTVETRAGGSASTGPGLRKAAALCPPSNPQLAVCFGDDAQELVSPVLTCVCLNKWERNCRPGPSPGEGLRVRADGQVPGVDSGQLLTRKEELALQPKPQRPEEALTRNSPGFLSTEQMSPCRHQR